MEKIKSTVVHVANCAECGCLIRGNHFDMCEECEFNMHMGHYEIDDDGLHFPFQDAEWKNVD